MKKRSSAVIRLIVCLLTAAILVGLLAVALHHGLFGIGSYYYKDADEYKVGPLKTSDYDEIEKIEINWEKGSVKIESYEGRELSLSEEGGETDDDLMRYRIKDGTLTVQYCRSRFFSFCRRPEKGLTVKLPGKLLEKLDTLKLDVVSADVSLASVGAKNFELDAVSGMVNALGVSFGTVDVDTVSGNVTFSGEADEITIDCVSADSTLTLERAPKVFDLDSVSGDLTLALAECDGFTLDFDKVSGDLSSDFPVTERDGKRIFGDGSVKIKVDTVSGDVKLEKLGQ